MRTVSVLLCLILAAACGAPEIDATDGEARARDQAMRRGELLSSACQACHTLARDADHHIGPNLFGVFGRTAGTVPGFEFSDALKGLDLVWSPAALDRWLADPIGFAPGTTMLFTGYQDPEDRRLLIEYLEAATR